MKTKKVRFVVFYRTNGLGVGGKYEIVTLNLPEDVEEPYNVDLDKYDPEYRIRWGDPDYGGCLVLDGLPLGV